MASRSDPSTLSAETVMEADSHPLPASTSSCKEDCKREQDILPPESGEAETSGGDASLSKGPIFRKRPTSFSNLRPNEAKQGGRRRGISDTSLEKRDNDVDVNFEHQKSEKSTQLLNADGDNPVVQERFGSNDADEALALVASLKSIQKARKTSSGVNAQISAPSKSAGKFCGDQESEDSGVLGKQFSARSITKINQTEDKHLGEFLAERMNLKAKSDIPKDASSVSDKMSELYQVPEHLQVEDAAKASADKMNWVTGLVEVPVPIDVKLKNIEATEYARRKLLKLGKLEEDKEDLESNENVLKRAFGPRFQNVDYKKMAGKKRPNDRSGWDSFKRRLRG